MASLILYSGNDPFYLGLVSHLITLSRKRGQEPVMMDLTDISAGVGDQYNRKALRVFGIQSPERRFSAMLRLDGLETVEAHQYLAVDNSNPQLPMSDGSRTRIEEALRSALISYARDPLPNTSTGRWHRFRRTLRSSAESAYIAVFQILVERPEISQVYVANGRFPLQRAVVEAARACDRRVLFYEKGDVANTFWLSDHSVLDRVSTQRNVDATLAQLSEAEAVAAGQEWMNGRASVGSGGNIYNRFFKEEAVSAPAGEVTKRAVVGLFTSSQDEFAALGVDWHLDEWADQWQAFDHVLNHLEQFDLDVYLRVHPNFATKSDKSFRRERRSLLKLQDEHPALRVIWHDEQVNSYALLGRTDVVVVWNSTMGLEASGRGIPVWELAASYYDLYADVRQWFSPAADPGLDEFDYEVDVSRTHRFMAYLARRHTPLPAEAVAIQTSLRPTNYMARLAAIATTGGAPTAAVAFTSIVDSVKHRRMSINTAAARRFFSRR